MKIANVEKWMRFGTLAVFPALITLAASDNADYCTTPSRYNVAINITSQADADSWSNCTILTGNLIISGDNLTSITLNGIESLNGKLQAKSIRDLFYISAPALKNITGDFILSDLPNLSTLDLPLLNEVRGFLSWDTLPILTNGRSDGKRNLNGPQLRVDGPIEVINTGLSSVEFLDFTWPTSFTIKDNRQLSKVDFAIDEAITVLDIVITNNGHPTEILIPTLVEASNITINDASNIKIPALMRVNNLNISNNMLQMFAAPELEAIGALTITNNINLENVSLPELSTISSKFMISNNTALQSITDIDQLRVISGETYISGNFSSVFLPSLETLTQSFNLTTTTPSQNFDCSPFDLLRLNHDSWATSNNEDALIYTCSAIPPGRTEDIAQHYSPPSKPALSNTVRAFVILLSILAGLALFAWGLRCWGRRKLIARATGGMGRGEEVVLGDIREGGDDLPEYSRVGKPGEVPPGYAETRARDAVDAVAGEVSDGSRQRGGRGFWERVKRGRWRG